MGLRKRRAQESKERQARAQGEDTIVIATKMLDKLAESQRVAIAAPDFDRVHNLAAGIEAITTATEPWQAAAVLVMAIERTIELEDQLEQR